MPPVVLGDSFYIVYQGPGGFRDWRADLMVFSPMAGGVFEWRDTTIGHDREKLLERLALTGVRALVLEVGK
jgi:hypothetical protein